MKKNKIGYENIDVYGIKLPTKVFPKLKIFAFGNTRDEKMVLN